MNYLQKITKIRDRGQLTVPYEIRATLNWPQEELMVRVETTANGFKVERLPVSHPQNPKKKLSSGEWSALLKEMKKISRMGKKKVNLGEFLRRDRDAHL